MRRSTLIAVWTVLGIGVIARVVSLASLSDQPPTESFDRAPVLTQIERLESQRGDAAGPLRVGEASYLGQRGVEQVERFVFAADAAIVLGPGQDGEPGQAGIDDNLNEVVDDPGEMGAVGSDDTCLAPADPGYDAASENQGALVISRGGFVPAEQFAADRYRMDRLGWFVP
ncbi:hypothetical protein FYK55_20070 [Roseiconus nitratireducens]|uniref:Uncharacterized protein n=1 Tax=Roseiconus nitratireducens TaxID=2605748 RepID=A0A5M6D256_9BACT|nr:hypothetical protein [Roseiconus nitratireducens]KAA5540690.1 hypothetical protein FYK55_20070 [Roseiconus nitratireducens]